MIMNRCLFFMVTSVVSYLFVNFDYFLILVWQSRLYVLEKSIVAPKCLSPKY